MKTYRVYFNKKSEWPLVWSIDEGDQDTEINVKEVTIIASYSETRAIVNNGHIDTTNTPLAWLAVEAKGIRIVEGIATIW